MNKERPTQEEREAVAQDIREGGEMAGEVMMEEIGLAEPVILAEAEAEAAEGGGPVADAVAELDKQLDKEASDFA